MSAPSVPVNFRKAASVTPLSVTPAVSGLQFDIVTDGTVCGDPTLSCDSYGGKVLVWVTTNRTFHGEFANVIGGTVTSISNVLASDIDGNVIAGVTVS